MWRRLRGRSRRRCPSGAPDRMGHTEPHDRQVRLALPHGHRRRPEADAAPSSAGGEVADRARSAATPVSIRRGSGARTMQEEAANGTSPRRSDRAESAASGSRTRIIRPPARSISPHQPGPADFGISSSRNFTSARRSGCFRAPCRCGGRAACGADDADGGPTPRRPGGSAHPASTGYRRNPYLRRHSRRSGRRSRGARETSRAAPRRRATGSGDGRGTALSRVQAQRDDRDGGRRDVIRLRSRPAADT